MAKPRKTTTLNTIPAYIARTQLGSILRQVDEKKARFVITKNGKPTAVLMGISDLDDIMEELDPEFQKSLKAAHGEFQSGKAVTLQNYMKKRLAFTRSA